MKNVKKALLTMALLATAATWALDIVQNGKSNFVIYHDAKAPTSVLEGAKDLQEYCQKVTGIKLPIVNQPSQKMISLGANPASGVTAEGIPLEGYRIIVKNGSVFVIGEDTPNGKRCYGGGVSNGTRNGVYALLEECFGVRWVMPGPYGDYYEHKDTVTVPDSGIESAPGFLNRRLPYIQEFTDVSKEWGRRQKLGWSLFLYHSHNWVPVCTVDMFEDHPEWYAMHGGVREQPSGDRYMLCISNPSTIQRFADAACEYFAKNPLNSTFSLSPSDGGGWCECDECKKMYETDPEGKLSTTPAVLHFYNEVTKLVRAKYPDRFLGGYVYAQYIYPPKTPIPLEDGLVLTLATSFNYGYKMFAPKYKKLTEEMFAEWTKSTHNISYYDLPVTWWRNEMACINGPGLELLKFVYPRAKAADMKGVYVYGLEAWGHAGVTNYLLAKLAWNPNLDIDATFSEYCDCAYGAASPEMQQIYHMVDDSIKACMVAAPQTNMVPSNDMVKKVYIPILPKVAELFAAGAAKVKGDTENGRKQLQRLEYFRNNVKILEWSCRSRNLLPKDYPQTIFTADEDEIASFYEEGVHRIAYYNKPWYLPKLKNKIDKLGDGISIERSDNPRQTAIFRGDQSLVFKAKEDGELAVTFNAVRTYGDSPKLYFYDKNNKPIKWYFLKKGVTRTLPVKKGEIYRGLINTKQDFYQLDIKNAWWGAVSEITDQGVHFIGNQSKDKVQTVYFHVPEGTEKFQMWLAGGDHLKETAKSTVTTPTGRKIIFNCSYVLCDKQWVDVKPGEAGFWRMDTTEGDRSYIDDYFIRILKGIPPIIFTDTENAFYTK
ncbi:MAG: DUF4838 domain-containing protein [Victivallales bacterium]|nr:DUF4838 domain-containing protein [Victivallales bacterium]